MSHGVSGGHGPLERVADHVLATDSVEKTRMELHRSCMNAGLSLGQQQRFLNLFNALTSSERTEPLPESDRNEFLQLVKQAKMEHKVRYVPHQMGCMAPDNFWEMRTFVDNAVTEVKRAVEAIKERLVSNGATKVVIGRMQNGSDAGIFAQFDENAEMQEPWEHYTWGGPMPMRAPFEVVGFRFVTELTELVSHEQLV